MSEWRPEGWEENKPRLSSDSLDEYANGYAEGVEVGADAMLGEICKLTDGTHIMLKLFRNSKGEVNLVECPQEFFPDKVKK